MYLFIHFKHSLIVSFFLIGFAISLPFSTVKGEANYTLSEKKPGIHLSLHIEKGWHLYHTHLGQKDDIGMPLVIKVFSKNKLNPFIITK